MADTGYANRKRKKRDKNRETTEGKRDALLSLLDEEAEVEVARDHARRHGR